MNLEDQIAQMTNPQEFTRLCNTLLTECYGGDFQIIDGTRGDGGNDGYIISEKRIIAIHCPIKPERKTDKDFLAKIKGDLKKAYNLHCSGKYNVKDWTFITPRKLSSNVISQMRSMALELRISAYHQESTYLANELYRNRHLIQSFPELHILDIDRKLDEFFKHVKKEPREKAVQNAGMNFSHVYKPDTKNDEEFNKVIEIRESRKTNQSIKALRGIFYKSIDPVIQLNAILGILDFSNPLEDDENELIELCESGINIAKKLKNKSIQAYFLAQKGYILSIIYAELDMRMASSIRMDNAVGISTVTEEKRQKTISTLRLLDDDFTQAFNQALDLSRANNDSYALASVLVLIGNAACQKSMYLPSFGVVDKAEEEKRKCKKVLLIAKDIYAQMGDDLGVAHALFNLANNIRFLGEKEDAFELMKVVLETARKYDDKDLLQKAIWLEESLKTGKVPDYVHGERRE